MLALLLSAVLLVPGGPNRARQACDLPVSCDGNGPGGWLLVYRWTYVDDDGVRKVSEMFDGRRFENEEHAYCGAALLRQTGVRLPTLTRYGRDSNVMPESITPMPHLLALELGIRGIER